MILACRTYLCLGNVQNDSLRQRILTWQKSSLRLPGQKPQSNSSGMMTMISARMLTVSDHRDITETHSKDQMYCTYLESSQTYQSMLSDAFHHQNLLLG